ncbi:MAG: hypothetical protein Crog4KO_13260 [Crocinitomicaceae bacterium]
MGERRNINVNWVYAAFRGMYAVIFSLICFKSFTVPITHDEGWTVIKYLDKSTWEIMMYPDNWPNNHILNTLLAKASAGIFGVHDWSVRLPNLLFFWVFALGVFRFLKVIFNEKQLWILPAAALFILSPYFLDFFGLCRGYGMASALTMLSLSYFVRGYKFRIDRFIWWGFFCAILASYANFTVLIYFAAASAMTGFYFLLYRKNWLDFSKKVGGLFLIMVGYAALIYTPIYKMKSTNQFEFWTSKGFYEETIASVIHNSLSDSSLFTRHEWFAQLVLFLTLVLWVIALRFVWRKKQLKSAFQNPLVVVSAILLLTVLVNLAQTNLLGDPNLNGRTALFLLPLFSALVVIGLHLVIKQSRIWVSYGITAVILLVTFQHWTMSYRSDSFKEWRYDKHTLEVIDVLKKEVPEKTVLRVEWIYQNSFEFYQKYEMQEGWRLQLGNESMNVNPNAKVDFYYVQEASVAALEKTFSVVKRYDEGQVLMRRKQ